MSQERAREAAAALEDAREDLVTAGMLVFAEVGVEDATTDRVCHRAGRSPGEFARLFADRDAVLAEVMDRAVRAFLAAVVGDGGDIVRSCEVFVECLSAGGVYPAASGGAPHLHAVLAACARSERFRGRYVVLLEECRGALEGLLRTAQAQGRVRADTDPAALARLLLAGTMGLQMMVETGSGVDVRSLVAAAARLFQGPPGDNA
ncbi:MAG: TetR/AcrR family transcriptional regulator [Deltaproteobacteria bacterium]|nr:TetR/AcrR family transcriptional regulator [Deltaproteobacteria bacterium]